MIALDVILYTCYLGINSLSHYFHDLLLIYRFLNSSFHLNTNFVFASRCDWFTNVAERPGSKFLAMDLGNPEALVKVGINVLMLQ